MKQQEIQERNKQIALMLGYDTPVVDKDFYFVEKNNYIESSVIPKLLELNFEKRFHSDWNWLMEAVEFIEKLKGMSIYISKNRMNKLHSVEISYEDNTWQKRPHIDKTIFIQNELKKEAVFIAVSDFAKLYNEKKL